MLVSTIATFFVLVWPIGLPVLLFWSLWRVREKIYARDEDTMKLFEFAVGDYSDKYWYWELVELGRKLVLSGLIGLFGRGSVAQIVTGCLVAFFFFALHFRAQPFEVGMLNAVESFSEFIVFGVLLVCTVQQAHYVEFAEESVSIRDYGRVQTLLCMMLLPITCFYLARHIGEMRERKQKTKREWNSDMAFQNPMNGPDSNKTSTAIETE
eukprot:SAG22_NODE_111_length_19607_cov_12.696637_16_plen_210_part_00